MAASCFSFVSLYEKYHVKAFKSCNLSPQSIKLDSETEIHLWHEANNETATKPALILIHGFGANSLWQWRYQVEILSKRFSLYIPDLLFFGKSTTTSSERTEIFQAVCLVKVMEKLGVEKYSIVGTSYGGFVGYRMASLWPDRVEKIVIASSAVNLRLRDNEELIKKSEVEKIEDLLIPVTASGLRTLLSFGVHKLWPVLPDFLMNDMIDSLFIDKREEKIQLLYGLTLGRKNSVDISCLQQEVLVVWGEHDKLFPLEKAYELKELLGEKASLEVIKKTSHTPQIENPKLFNDIVMTFLL
ncbi:hypothetical protein MKW94_019440 [Papaver nudicaule]|uniref:AB hydrolase-1 domain-containing protein n=1 Tax=Papaver nudicaule TaxID=74823 RepID=A0AA41VFK2_PAPNU|nr:hypothetical protein [Papaver nudicaule]